MSSTDMAQDFAGMLSKHGLPMNKPHAPQGLSLFLPECVSSLIAFTAEED